MYAAHSSWIWLYDVYIHSHIELLYIDVHLDTDTEDMDTQRPLPRQAQKSHACQSASRATRLAATAPRRATPGFCEAREASHAGQCKDHKASEWILRLRMRLSANVQWWKIHRAFWGWMSHSIHSIHSYVSSLVFLKHGCASNREVL